MRGVTSKSSISPRAFSANKLPASAREVGDDQPDSGAGVGTCERGNSCMRASICRGGD